MKELLKETGKYLYDISKIILAVGLITPMINETDFSFYSTIVASVVFILGGFMIYKGGREK